MPDPPGLVVKNGTNRFDAFVRPAPSSSIHSSKLRPSRFQPTVTPPPVCSAASAALCTQVDQQLLELIRIGADR